MQPTLVIFALISSLFSIPTRAELEDGLEKCSDGLDNDGDGFTDCDEMECVSSLESCGFCVRVGDDVAAGGRFHRCADSVLQQHDERRGVACQRGRRS